MFWKAANLIRWPFLRSAHNCTHVEWIFRYFFLALSKALLLWNPSLKCVCLIACYYYVVLYLGQNACCDWLFYRPYSFEYSPLVTLWSWYNKKLFTFFLGLHVRYTSFFKLVFLLFCFVFFSISLLSFEARALDHWAFPLLAEPLPRKRRTLLANGRRNWTALIPIQQASYPSFNDLLYQFRIKTTGFFFENKRQLLPVFRKWHFSKEESVAWARRFVGLR